MTNGGDTGGDKGRTVGGRYRLLERIGSGGMGTVWRARDELVDREVAVKEPRLPGDPEDEAHRRAAHRLYREARAAARVDHPSAVSIHDVVVEEGDEGLQDGLPWIVMELIRGESLHEVLRRGPLEAAEAARIGLAVLGALRAAHAVGIVHRDVKPANVLLGPHGRVVLTDFGIAHVQGEESLTVSGEFVGSLEFIAPERMSGRGAGPASDLWSLGVLLYAAVEGWSPFRRTTLESTLAAILAADLPEPKQAGPLGPLLVRLLSRAPDRRPGPAEVAAVLEAVAEGRPVTPFPAAGEETEGAEPQDVGQLRELGDDAGTVRLAAGGGDGAVAAEGGADAVEAGEQAEGNEPDSDGSPERDAGASPEPGSGASPARGAGASPEPDSGASPVREVEASPEPDSGASPESATAAHPSRPFSRGPFHRRSLPLALLTVLLACGAWLGVAFLGKPDSGAITEWTGTYTPASEITPTPERTTPWVIHRESDMNAVLSLPVQYRESARQGSASGQPRLVVYSAGSVDVRLTQWDEAPSSPADRAAQAHRTWDGYDGDARTQTTRTTFQGHAAVLADTTYGMEGSPTRVMELFVRTDDSRMYELRVDMPKGTPDEKQGTAVFKAARDRLRIGTP
ncbi:serine/threonine-protein kinase [Streptomyces aurantiogriseus]|uniref:non-specific serine/threonine protein kinase n=1 Tax=Streptomyces aurantiogriseus TaxID=66870 RepID=A0A918C127_9ACTN|nr:serine/threonine-protein kinase [Streptomyces aurantiogriseus]GGR00294.1 hypothetical protein GCM10010251_14550 [Streptomyces aurantiogriseus]